MRSLTHWRDERNHFFQLHPWHATFSLLASLIVAGLVVLVLVESAK